MFIDYYAVQNLEQTATSQEIKEAFKRQAIKWHPDKNVGVDTTPQMQTINEAYLILKDSEARARYDIQYQRFKKHHARKTQQETEQDDYDKNKAQNESWESDLGGKYTYSDFYVNDDILKKWMSTARKQAVDLAKQSIEDFKGMATAGVKGATQGCLHQFLAQIIIGIVFTFLFLLNRSCNN